MREKYSKELSKLNEEIIDYGLMAEKILEMSIKSLFEKDVKLAQETIDFEHEMDVRAEELEEKCLNILALQQPMAKDLRVVSAIIQMISDLERIGDLSEDIAEITIEIDNNYSIDYLIVIPEMYEMSKDMIKKAIDCYIREDISLAKKVFNMDDLVDKLFKNINTEIFNQVSKESNYIQCGMNLLLVARYLERIADHATNICEGVNYIVTGTKKFSI